jgi:PIN domain nuclease of toxin-antitoxin system
VKCLLDTHILVWAASSPDRLSDKALEVLSSEHNDLIFSVASIWELTIKTRPGRPDFKVDAALLRRGLIEAGYSELPISGLHALAVADLKGMHRDPFDQMLLAQAHMEGMTLVTSDRVLATQEGSIMAV